MNKNLRAKGAHPIAAALANGSQAATLAILIQNRFTRLYYQYLFLYDHKTKIYSKSIIIIDADIVKVE
ncbi:hypothetical protein BpHYR1_007296 [Brachionus plicatilis]|uniref:Uncharacterized protein n=1 Tax=Brachionus plicatilis TaxID=10195 RepID=A0A3M7P6L1_BRAPC|nr:hypothetical protein BpHYR1_007296 [Brachionus plicatilis]